MGEATSVMESLSDGFTVYPTLFDELVHVKGLSQDQYVEVFDILGKSVYRSERSLPAAATLSLDNLEKGFYILGICNAQGVVSSQKIIKR